ncbi:hypothetical protein FB567DRAFT_620323 [Paraphoma chrysanthemicola]|uniref:Uncharacterized protein n=1 Tax=Paraphoma chrysanthemicola TaxID=798071 RepID=A0A8K0VZW0_9PLEO|nr:hypothetical protein FB567DRAFT_620323 [Paraphoma chrysanthemicola]
MAPSALARLGLLALLSTSSLSVPIAPREVVDKRAAALCTEPDVSWEKKHTEGCPICVDETLPRELFLQYCGPVMNPAVVHMDADGVWRRDRLEQTHVEDAKAQARSIDPLSEGNEQVQADFPTRIEVQAADPTITEAAKLRRDDYAINLAPGAGPRSQVAMMHAVQQAVYKRQPVDGEEHVPTTTTTTDAEAATELPEEVALDDLEIMAPILPIERPLELFPRPHPHIPRPIPVIAALKERSNSREVLLPSTNDVEMIRGANKWDLNFGIPPKYIPDPRYEAEVTDREEAALSKRMDEITHRPAFRIYKSTQPDEDISVDESRLPISPRGSGAWESQEPGGEETKHDAVFSGVPFGPKAPYPVTHQPAYDLWRRKTQLAGSRKDLSEDAHHDTLQPLYVTTPVLRPEVLDHGPVLMDSEIRRRSSASWMDASSSQENNDAILESQLNADTIVHHNVDNLWRRVDSNRPMPTNYRSSKSEDEELFDHSASARPDEKTPGSIMQVHRPAPIVYRRASTEWQPPVTEEYRWRDIGDSLNENAGRLVPTSDEIASEGTLDSVTMYPVMDVYRKNRNDNEPYDYVTFMGDETTAHELDQHPYEPRDQQPKKRYVPAPELLEDLPWSSQSNHMVQRRSLEDAGSLTSHANDVVNGVKNMWESILNKGEIQTRGISDSLKDVWGKLRDGDKNNPEKHQDPSSKPNSGPNDEMDSVDEGTSSSQRADSKYKRTDGDSQEAFDTKTTKLHLEDPKNRHLNMGPKLKRASLDVDSLSFDESTVSMGTRQRRSTALKDLLDAISRGGSYPAMSNTQNDGDSAASGGSMSGGSTSEMSNTSADDSTMGMSNSANTQNAGPTTHRTNRRGLVDAGDDLLDSPRLPPVALSHMTAPRVWKVRRNSRDQTSRLEDHTATEGPESERRDGWNYISDPKDSQTSNPADVHGLADSLWRPKPSENGEQWSEAPRSSRREEFDDYIASTRGGHGLTGSVISPATELSLAPSAHRRARRDGSSSALDAESQFAEEHESTPRLLAIIRRSPDDAAEDSYREMLLQKIGEAVAKIPTSAAPAVVLSTTSSVHKRDDVEFSASNTQKVAQDDSAKPETFYSGEFGGLEAIRNSHLIPAVVMAPATSVHKRSHDSMQDEEPKYRSDAWYEKYCSGDLTREQWRFCYAGSVAITLPPSIAVYRRDASTVNKRGFVDTIKNLFGFGSPMQQVPNEENYNDEGIEPDGSVHTAHSTYEINSVYRRGSEDVVGHGETQDLETKHGEGGSEDLAQRDWQHLHDIEAVVYGTSTHVYQSPKFDYKTPDMEEERDA